MPFRPPVPQTRTLRCGLPLWVVPRHDLPITALTFVLEGGGGRQSTGQAGLAQLTAAMMDEGTTTRSSHELALAAEGMGTTLSTSCGWDGTYVTLHCLTPHLPASLDLAVDVLRNPTFPEPEWRRIHGQTLAALRAERDSAESRSYRAILAALYPDGHPYRLPLDGSENIVSQLGRDDLRLFRDQFHGPSGAACIVAGDVDPDQVAEWVDERLEGWRGPALSSAELTVPGHSDRPRILLLDRPGAAQAVVRAGHVGIRRLDPDYTAMLLLNQILGGQFTSRLNTKLREEKGFTYGVRSHFDSRVGSGPFSITASIQTDRVAEALEDLRAELTALRGTRPATTAELEDARRSLIEGQARHFETPSALISRFATLFIHGLSADHHAQFADRLENETIESLSAAVVRQLHPDSLVTVVVGDAELLREPLERLGWAEVELIKD